MAANNTINVGLNVSSNGTTDAETKKAEALSKALAKAASTANNVNKATAAARQGVAATNANKGVDTSGDSGKSRSLGAGTGAASRDFAKQASGLGGLVHVYATFAANLFAISAGFTALSKAADVSNMVKGLDQLGAASGRNLGTLAKQLASVSDGALSLKDAMTATAQATSGGMSSKDLIRLTQVAKNASQALGRDMSDAVSRLSRGITKIEPELLDELGIMVRVDTASQKYALSLGKSVSALTDFEKHQAFANAVLEQGEKKFGNINLDANPYQKILASITNLTQSGLELVNKVLGPIVNMLSSSPSALTATLAGLGTLLLRQAIPALGAYRQSMKAAAEESHVRLQKIFNDQQTLGAEADQLVADKAVASFKKSAETQTKLAALKFTSTIAGKKDFQAIANKSPFDITDDDISALKNRAKYLSSVDKDNYKEEGARLKKHVSDILAIRQDASNLFDTTASANELKESGRFSHQTQLLKIYDKANQDASNRRILAATSEAAATLGPVRSWKLLNEEIAKSKSGKATIDVIGADGITKIERAVPATGALTNGITRMKGAFSIATSSVSTFLSAFSVWGAVIGLGVAAVQLLDSWLSDAAKQIDEFNSALDRSKENISFVDVVLKKLYSAGSSEWLTADSINARANAFNNVSTSIEDAFNKFGNIKIASSGYDRFIDSIAGVFGSSHLDKLAKVVNASILKSIELMEPGKARDEYLSKIKDIYSIDEVTAKTLASAPVTDAMLEKAINAQKITAKKVMNAAEESGASQKAFEGTTKALQNLITAAQAGDNISKFGKELILQGEALDKTFKTTESAFQELVRLSKESGQASMLGNMGIELVKNTTYLQNLNNEYNTNVKALLKLKEIQGELSKDPLSNSKYSAETSNTVSKYGEAIAPNLKQRKEADTTVGTRKQDVADQIKMLEASQVKLEASRKREVEKYSGIVIDTYAKGLNLIGKSFSLIIEGGLLKVQGTIASIMGGIEGIKLGAEVATKELSLRQESNSIMIELIKSNQANTLVTEGLKLTNEKKLTVDALADNKSNVNRDMLSAKLVELNKSLDVNSKAISILKASGGNTFGAYKKAATDKDENTRLAAGSVRDTALAVGNLEATNAAIQAEKKAVAIKAEVDVITKKYDTLTKLATDNIALAEAASKDLLQLSGLNNSMLLQSMANAQAELVDKEKLNILELDRNKTIERFTVLYEAANSEKVRDGIISDMVDELALLDSKVSVQKESNRQALLARDIADITKQSAIDSLKISRDKAEFDSRTDLASANLDNITAEIEARRTLGTIYEKDRLELLKNLDIQKAQLALMSAQASAQNALKTARSEAKSNLDKSVSTINSGNSGNKQALLTEAQNTYNDALAHAATLENNASQAALSRYNANIKGINAVTESLQHANWLDELTKKLEGFADSMTTVFGDLGTKIGGAIKDGALAFESFTKSQADLDTNLVQTKLKNAKNYANDSEKLAKANSEAKTKYDNDSAQNSLNFIGKEAKSIKSLFSEKTAAYKIMAAVERAIHIAKLAMWAKEAIAAVTASGTEIAANGAKAASSGVAAIAAALAAPFPIGFIAGAAMTAVVASLLGGFLSKKPSIPAGFTAEESQKVMGTGQTYKGSTDGKPVTREGGVLGDPTAMSKSITDSIELLSKEVFGQVSPQISTMIGYLKGIEDNTKQLAKSLISTGIFGTSPLGIKESSSKSSGGLGGLGVLLGPLGLLGGLFGSSSTTIEDQGIKIKGTFDSISEGIGQFDQFVNTLTKSSSWFGLRKRSSTDTALEKLDPSIQKNITNIFKSVNDTLISAGVALEGTGTRVADIIKEIPIEIDASSKGLSATEFANKLISGIGIILNVAAEKAFPYMKEYVGIGEEYYATVARVVKEGETLNRGLSMMGMSLNTLGDTTEVVVAKQQNVIDKFMGGIDEFTSSVQYFFDNFKTDSQKTAYYTKELSNGFKALNISVVPTKEGFTNLIESLDLTDDKQAELYAGLIKLAPAMEKVAAATEKLRQGYLSQHIKNLQLEGRATEALAAAREEELNNLDPLLRAGRELQFQLEDQAKMHKLDIELASASGRTYEALVATRLDELAVLTDSEKVMKLLVYKAQDQLKINGLQLEVLNALGFANDALQLQRKAELAALSEEEQVYKKRVYELLDFAKTQSLEIDLMEAAGDTTGALTARRKLELRGLSATDAALKSRIWLLQDEKKLMDQKLSQEAKIYELLGKSEEALRITRAQELAQLDPQLVANQLYIYALEDEAALKDKLKTAYDKESTALKDTISKTKDFTKTLRDYRDSLLLSDNSILTPAQKYAEAKRQYLQTAAIATSLAVTDAQKQAQSDAVSKLPTVSDNFLQASRTLYASSDAYTADFNSVLETLDRTASYFDGQQPTAEKQLAIMENDKTIQEIIRDNTGSVKDLLAQYLASVTTTEAARQGAAAAGSNAAGGTFAAPTASAVTMDASVDTTGVGYVKGKDGFSGTIAQAKEAFYNAQKAGSTDKQLYDAVIRQGFTSSMVDTILGQPAGTALQWAIDRGFPKFANGGVANGLSVVGELGPELVNFGKPSRVYSNDQSNSMFGTNQELVKEVQALREELKQLRLEQNEQTGALIRSNYDANRINSDEIKAATLDAANADRWNRNAIPKLA